MRDLNVVDRVELGTAYNVEGGYWRVMATGHNREWPGSGDRMSFACERVENGTVVEAVGFFSEEDCWNFLTGYGPKEYEVYETDGSTSKVVRDGRRIPDGLVKRYGVKLN